ncbi:MAG TPA: hypothetical protein ENK88_07735, partial [Campylobacterales bacterium]|nr:hypothetical protein [Campylobacterales bacterium]
MIFCLRCLLLRSVLCVKQVAKLLNQVVVTHNQTGQLKRIVLSYPLHIYLTNNMLYLLKNKEKLMNKKIFKPIIISSISLLILSGCTVPQGANGTTSSGLSKAQIGAITGGLLGAVVGGATDTKHTTRGRRIAIGGAAGAAVGAAIGYSLDQQAKEVAQVLNTDVDNSPTAERNPNNDLVVSNTDKFVKIMFRSQRMFATNSPTPTSSARVEIQNMLPVFRKYPNMIIQTVGHTD